jgi:hypothetical protein
MTRANYAGAMDAKRKLQEMRRSILAARRTTTSSQASACIAAQPRRRPQLRAGGAPRDRAGGRFDGHELPDDINAMTKASATALAGLG